MAPERPSFVLNVSDGTGEAAVKKIDVSALSVDPVSGAACSKVTIEKIWYTNIGMGVKIFFDADTDVLAWQLNADYSDELDFSEFSGIPIMLAPELPATLCLLRLLIAAAMSITSV